jgi:microcystin-dependent protein
LMKISSRSLISIPAVLAVFLFASTIFFSANHKALADSASLSLSTSSENAVQGSNIAVSIYENSKGKVNAVSVRMNYSADMLDYNNTVSSPAFSIEAATKGGDGKVLLDRGALPSVDGKQLLATVNFTVRASSGLATIDFGAGNIIVSSVTNTNIISSTVGTQISVGQNSSGSATNLKASTLNSTSQSTQMLNPESASSSAACDSRSQMAKNTMSRISDRGQKQLDLFTTISDRTQAFYKISNKNLSGYSNLAYQAYAKRSAAVLSINILNSDSAQFSCGNNPKESISKFQDDVNSEVNAMQAYRSAVKNLVVGVRSVL